MVQVCSVIGCKTEIKTGQDPGPFKFYRYPRSSSVLEQWKQALKIDRVGKNDRICNIHFQDSDLRLTNLGWKILIPTAVPTLFLPEHVKSECDEIRDEATIKVEVEEDSCNHEANQGKSVQCSGNTAATHGVAEASHVNQNSVSPAQENTPSVGYTASNTSNNINANVCLSKSSHSSTDLHSCELCNKQFPSRIGLFLHLSVHYELKTYVCVCEEKFNSRLKFEEHVVQCQVQHLNTHSKEKSVQPSEEKPDEAVQEICKPFFCALCGALFDTMSELASHRAAGHNPKYCCKCDCQFISELALKSHVSNVHLAEKFVCCKCERLFGNPEDWISHIGQHALIHECPECCKLFEGIIELNAHFTCHESMAFYACNFCVLLFPSREAVKAHMKVQKTKHKDTKVECHFCSGSDLASQKVKGYFHLHQLYRGQTLCTATSYETTLAKRPLIGPRSVLKRPRFNRNEYLHQLGPRPLSKRLLIGPGHLSQSKSKVEVAGVTEASSKNDLDYLEIPKESGLRCAEVQLKCEDCNTVLRSRSEMKSHHDLHKSRGDFNCIECGKQFYSSLALSEHYRDHVKGETEDLLSSEESD